MSREELIAALAALDQGDPDGAKHELAIGLLLGFLSKEGYGDVVAAYLAARERVPFGYV
jgi:hypothetical protein